MKQYLDLMQHILDNGNEINDRTGVGTIATFGEQIKFNLSNGFPAVTTKKLAFKSMVSELIWFLRGSDNVHELRSILHGEENRTNLSKTTIWDANYNNQARELRYTEGFMGDIYGVQWRNFGKETLECYFDEDRDCWMSCNGDIKGVDQISLVLKEAKINPSSRRLLVSAWNPKVVWDYQDEYIDVNKAALPPCHLLFQLNIVDNKLNMLWYQRSVDVLLGLPFNIASYALLTHIFARILNLEVGVLTGSLGDTHIYKNHVNQAKEQLSRDTYDLPEIWINPELETLEDFCNSTIDDYKLISYNHHPTIKADMAV